MKKSKLTVVLIILAVVVVLGAAAGLFLHLVGDIRGNAMISEAEEEAAEAQAAAAEAQQAAQEAAEAQAQAEAEAAAKEEAAQAEADAEAQAKAEEEAQVQAEEEAAAQEEAAVEEEPDELTQRAAALLDELTLEEKVCQLLFVTPEVLTGYNNVNIAGGATQAALEQYPVGGIIYFAQNLQSTEQVSSMLHNTLDYSSAAHGIGVFTAVDEEGGTVARCAKTIGTTSYSSMRTYGDAGDTQAVYDIGASLASDLTELGFNVDFAPVADVITNPNNTEIGDRSFGTDAELVSDMVSAEVSGMKDGDLCATLKHFPGLGSTSTNSHTGLDESSRTMDELLDCEMLPFEAGIEAGAPFIMVGHMTLTEVDSVPCSLSSKIVTDLLRDQLGYDGIVITDAFNMAAITDSYSQSEAAVMALQAGVDMLLCVSDIPTVRDAILDAVSSGELTEDRIDESVMRILKVKLEYGIAS